jgi:DNA-binding response OmpR family regulator
MDKHIVLVALSDAGAAAAFEARLSKAGHDVMRAYAADQIEAILPKRVFSMVVLDLGWLGTGFPLVRRMREGRFTARLPLVVVAEKGEQIPFAMQDFGVLPLSYKDFDRYELAPLVRDAQTRAQKQKGVAAATLGGSREKKIKVLVVDDNYDAVELLHDRLEMEGFSVDVAYDGVEALNKIWKAVPDIVILDIMMPKIDGMGVLKNLKDQGYIERVPVIVSSAKSAEADILLAKKFGAVAYETKPYKVSQLVATLRRYAKNNG